MGQIHPKPEQIQELLQGPADTPVVMVNLLRFKKDATEPDVGLTGADAYTRYAEQMIVWVESQGGRLIWSGRVDSWVIGDTDEHFDVIAMMEYPSREAFTKIAGDPRVAEYSVHRTAGLEMQWLIATTTAAEAFQARSADAP